MNRRLVAFILACALASFLLAGCLAKSSPETGDWTVVHVVDGDTIDVTQSRSSGAPRVRVRLLGIDTPESVDPRRPVQCFGVEASRKTSALVEGKAVRLEADALQGDEDDFGRLLRYVHLADGTHVNLWLLRNGYAHEYTYRLPYRYQADFREAQKAAEREALGLWSPTTCSGKTG